MKTAVNLKPHPHPAGAAGIQQLGSRSRSLNGVHTSSALRRPPRLYQSNSANRRD
ncbi:MAG: hypothetical protein R3D55_25100 [Chloroflexota bacterium]